MPKISVIIPNYNYGQYLGFAIESALRQTYKPHEIIVVDDGSTDNSIEVAQKYPVTLIQQKNAGVSVARNTGVCAASGDVIAFLDSDDIWLPEKLERQAELLTDKVGLVCCGLGNELGVQLHEARTPEDVLLGKPTTFMGSSMMVRKDLGVRFTEGRTVSEDWEFGFKCSMLTEMKAAGVLVYYRDHGDGAHLDVRAMDRSMSSLYDEIFKDKFPEIKQESYARLHRMLAGSYLYSRSPRFLPHLIRSFYHNPRLTVL